MMPSPYSNHADVVLTGLPRAGTTLICHLLNKVPGVLALNEPMDVAALGREATRPAACEKVREFFVESRRSALASGEVFSQHVAGKIPDNVVGNKAVGDGLRKSEARRGLIAVDKPLSTGFLLCIKHPSAFTALLPELKEYFPVFGIVRNPLSVLASWSSVKLSVSRGHVPAAENLDPGLRHELGDMADPIDRQIHLLGWFFGKYRSALDARAILRYEDVVSTGGRILAEVAAGAGELNEPLQERNASKLYQPESVKALSERLLASDGAYWDFYQRADVERVRDAILG